MTIGGVSDFGYGYQPYNPDRIPYVDVNRTDKTALKNQAEPEKRENEQPKKAAAEETLAPARKSTPLEDVSLTFHKDDTFDMIGSDSDLTKLDMSKAISDMQKDKILQDYSYFVGSSAGLLKSVSEDGIVIAK